MASAGVVFEPCLMAAALFARILLRDNTGRIFAIGTGTGLVIPDRSESTAFANFNPTTSRPDNVPGRKHLGTGLRPGFAIDGIGSNRVLIRAVGGAGS